jgi:hypothetical protein
MTTQRVRCAASDDGMCAWHKQDPDDGRPCVSLCALDIDIDAIRREG